LSNLPATGQVTFYCVAARENSRGRSAQAAWNGRFDFAPKKGNFVQGGAID
jgi:hypothetical protein